MKFKDYDPISQTALAVYVAGKYSDRDVISILENMRTGLKTARAVLEAGFAPFAPWLDYLFTLTREDHQTISLQDYYNYSMTWLDRSNCVLISHGHTESTGTQNEIKRAGHLSIPVYYDLETLKDDHAEYVINFKQAWG